MTRFAAIAALGLAAFVKADPPDVAYIFPAGAQRGASTPVRVGGYYFHGQANFEMMGKGVKFNTVIKNTPTIWFEGPLIYQPLSQQSEDYPKDHLNEITVAKNAALGQRLWRCWTSQGATKTLKFVIGDLPEMVENEMEGRPIPESINLPVTVNGRIFPREDVDIWSFNAKAGETIVCDAAAKRFGSPLNIVLAFQDSKGNPIASQKSIMGGDPIQWFKAPYTDRYEVHVHDAKFWGLQNHVYRLTLKRGPHILSQYPLGARRGTEIEIEFNGPALPSQRAPVSFKNVQGNTHLVDVKNWGTSKFVISDYPEQLESKKSTASTPVVFNGRITKPGEIDEWKIKLNKNEKITLELAATLLGSQLDAVLSMHDAEGKQLAINDDRAKNDPDPQLEFLAKTAGVYTLKVRDRFASRGGLRFAYRLTASETDVKPDFALSLDQNFLNLIRLAESPKKDAKPSGPKLKVTVNRQGGFKGEVKVTVTGLPPNVTVHNNVIASNKKDTSLQFSVPPKSKITMHQITIRGVGDLGDQNATRVASIPDEMDHLFCGIVPSVPFKHHGRYYIITGLPGGTTYHKKYSIDRGGFDGLISVRLTEKQPRHLQGVNDAIITVPNGVNDFSFPVQFPARIELGRTSRVCVMLVGVLNDFDGTKHKISYTSRERDDQLISVAAAGLVSVETSADSYTAAPDTVFDIPVTIRREPAVRKQAMKIELIQPGHAKGISANPVELAPDQSNVALKIQTAKFSGPYNAPFIVRATTIAEPRHVAEKKIELVAPAQ